MTDEELKALVASNARTIQGNASAISELGENINQQSAQISELRENITQQSTQISELRENITQQSTQISELRENITQQSTQIFELGENITRQGTQMMQGIAEVVSMMGELAAQQEARQAESDQRFNNLLADARADRQRADRDRAINENEHRAFRETFQTLLAEVARIWQRLA